MSIEFSVIIPVYNSEKTLRRCLDSIFSQLNDSVEIVIVNDGSSDSSAKICEEYLCRYNKIKFINQPNGGVSSARNAALDVACGKWIVFVDADDYVNEGLFSISDDTVDLLVFGASRTEGNSLITLKSLSVFEDDAYKSAKIIDYMFRNKMMNGPVRKMFRREIIERNNIRFDEKLYIGEDTLFVLEYSLYVNSVKSITDIYYVVCTENMESPSRRYRNDLTEQMLRLRLKQNHCIMEADISDNIKEVFYSNVTYFTYRTAYVCIAELRRGDKTLVERIKEARMICRSFSEISMDKFLRIRDYFLSLPIRLKFAVLITALLDVKASITK